MAENWKLLSDDPSDVDHFGGAHARIAERLTNLIRSDARACVVALEGSWGAGKSTVVQILNRSLSATLEDKSTESSNANVDVRIQVFDAWAHQGDPLRRSFLESATDCLRQANWVGSEWDDERETLTGRHSETTVKATPRLSKAGRFILLGALLAPIGLVFLNAVLGNEVSLLKLILALALTASVLVIAGLLSLVRLGVKQDRKADWDPLAPLANSYEREEQSSTIERGSPTSIEFENYFNRLMEVALKDEAKRFVIVLDNLDRIAPDDARAVLATLQTFKPSNAKPWSSRLWTIVPFDPSGLERLWSNDATVATDATEKLFDISFHVPQLIMSDWRQYLDEQLLVAMPDLEADPRAEITEIYAAVVLEAVGGPARVAAPGRTPRSIKRFVNALVAIRWSHPMLSAPAAAAFVLWRRSARSVEELLNTSTIPMRVQTILGPEWQQELAAAYFGTSKDNGIQLLLSQDLNVALLQDDVSRLEELARIRGFHYVLSHSPLEVWSSDDSYAFADVAGTVVRSNLMADTRITAFLTALRRRALELTTWSLYSERAGFGYGWMAKEAVSRGQLGPSDVVSRLELRTTFEQTSPSGPPDGLRGAIAFCRMAGELLAGCDPGIRFTGTAAEWIDLAAQLRRADETVPLWPLVETNASPDEVANAYLARLTEPPADLAIDDALGVLAASPTRVDSGILVQGCASQLSDPSNQARTRAALRSLWQIHGNPWPVDMTAVLHDAVTDGRLYNVAFRSNRQSDNESVAIAMLLQLLVDSNLTAPPVSDNNTEGYELLTAVRGSPGGHEPICGQQAELLSNSVPWLKDLSRASGEADPWVRWILARLTGLGTEVILDPEDVVRDWQWYADHVDADNLRNCVSVLTLEKGLAGRVSGIAPANWPEIAVHAVAAPDFRDSEFARWVATQLNEWSETEWTEAFHSDNPSVAYIVAWVEATEEADLLQLGVALESALRTVAERVADGERVLQLPDQVWQALIGTLRLHSARERLAGAAVHAASHREGALAEPFWDRFGPLMESERTVRTSREFASGVIESIIRSRDGAGVAWLHGAMTRHPDIVNSDAVDTDRLLAILDGTGEDAEMLAPLRDILETAR